MTGTAPELLSRPCTSESGRRMLAARRPPLTPIPTLQSPWPEDASEFMLSSVEPLKVVTQTAWAANSGRPPAVNPLPPGKASVHWQVVAFRVCARSGFEPLISGLNRRRPGPLDERWPACEVDIVSALQRGEWLAG